ncbi:Calvin cycle protein CP12 [Romeria aff. gracilis LEGE 07310]|uniref:Calvin cycle protein CP12 n=1 Tax=Vasconcelosia minhoensis LEGE 07310 TaxID=915328 RepID=A0A8J7DLS4_9CYAN|nr:Calvin cycle protein CP12 [Romeria gracilis]MBE9077586.1 Calvin cycle protein CP12 [Romeria aff. gracilis LEGE 07310]
MSDIQQQIESEKEAARAACSTDGSDSEACAAAWDAVEELQAEASHQRQTKPKKSSFEEYCENNPDADECRVYDN